MRVSLSSQRTSGQSALEYLLLFAIVAMVVLASFRLFLPKVRESAKGYHDKVSLAIMGEQPQPIDGGWCDWTPCTCQARVQFRRCECPEPSFGGKYCLPDQDGLACTDDFSKCMSACQPIAGNCSAPVLKCGDSQGVDNCGNACVRHGPKCGIAAGT